MYTTPCTTGNSTCVRLNVLVANGPFSAISFLPNEILARRAQLANGLDLNQLPNATERLFEAVLIEPRVLPNLHVTLFVHFPSIGKVFGFAGQIQFKDAVVSKRLMNTLERVQRKTLERKKSKEEEEEQEEEQEQLGKKHWITATG